MTTLMDSYRSVLQTSRRVIVLKSLIWVTANRTLRLLWNKAISDKHLPASHQTLGLKLLKSCLSYTSDKYFLHARNAAFLTLLTISGYLNHPTANEVRLLKLVQCVHTNT